MGRCSVNRCNGKSTLHRLPHDWEILQKWAINIGRPEILQDKVPLKVLRSRYRVCGKHFTDSCRFEAYHNRTNLKHRAIPTLLLAGIFGITGENVIGITNPNLVDTQLNAPATSDVPTVSKDLPTLPPPQPLLPTPATPFRPRKFEPPKQHENTIIITGLTITEVDEDDEPNPTNADEDVEITQEDSPEVNNLICRLCKGERKEMISLFSHEVFCDEQRQVFEIIEKCASIQIIRDDELPQFACLKCLEELHQAFKFRRLCEKTDAELRKVDTVEPQAEDCQAPEIEVISDAPEDNVAINQLKRGRLKQDFIRMKPVLYNKNQDGEKQPVLDKNRKYVLVKVPKNTTASRKVSEDNILVTSSKQNPVVNTEANKCESVPIIEELDSIINNPEYEMDISDIQNILPLVNFSLLEPNDKANKNKYPTLSCTLCGVTCNDDLSLKDHMKTHVDKRRIKSNLKPFLQFNRDSFKCKICMKTFKHPVTKEHIRSHKMRTMYKCLRCKIKFKSLDRIRQHLRNPKCASGQVGDMLRSNEGTSLAMEAEVNS